MGLAGSGPKDKMKRGKHSLIPEDPATINARLRAKDALRRHQIRWEKWLDRLLSILLVITLAVAGLLIYMVMICDSGFYVGRVIFVSTLLTGTTAVFIRLLAASMACGTQFLALETAIELEEPSDININISKITCHRQLLGAIKELNKLTENLKQAAQPKIPSSENDA